MIALRNLLFVVIYSLSLTTFGQAVLYVSPKGSGKTFSLKSPGNLEEVILKLQQSQKNKSGETLVHLKGGTYNLSKTIVLSSLESGSDANTITFSSAPGERALISGGKKITGWLLAGNGIYKAKLAEGSQFRQLYIDGKMAIRARTPNREHPEDYGPYNRIKRFDEKAKTVQILAAELPPVNKLREVELVINQHWYQSRLRIASYIIDKDSAAITIQEPERNILFGMTGNKMLWPEKPYYLENAWEFLDADNEWYLDKETQTLYYKPATGKKMEQLDVVAPMLETLVQISGTEEKPVHNITFKNIDFGYSTWLMPDTTGSILTQGAQVRGMENVLLPGTVQVQFARNFLLEDCSVFGSGANGIVFSQGVWNSKIMGNHIHEISANALVIDTYKKINPPQGLQCRDNTVAQNLIENIGLHYTNGMGLIASCVSGLIVEHNEIRYGRYSGMQIGNHYGDNSSGTQDNLVRFNNIHHVMLMHDDGGAIYTLSNQKGTQIYSNWIHDYTKCQWADNYPVNGVFLDNNSSYIQVKDNVFTDLPNVDQLKENKGTKVHDNVFLNNDTQDEGIKKQAGITKINTLKKR